MGVLKKIKTGLTFCDFFPHNQFLCYRDDSTYTTATGGCISILIIAIIIALVTSSAIALVNKRKVTSTVDHEQSRDPEYSEVRIGPEHNFMFVGIENFAFFDIWY